ncbi:hypothetical protein RFI_09389 [Reticulomyxa filosa]|uniref:Uncharacterized protein n=1 Tax=Reticulomyxa filosa TaxID=46433 RepID=X6NP91_RETFI|nr:hypothetical protein RFI_09389 [Reticulomyxa filosa]|eukprot:ETO27743.1 hypothetical protein RFI_09389 [Reticulomyxa filosa]
MEKISNFDSLESLVEKFAAGIDYQKIDNSFNKCKQYFEDYFNVKTMKPKSHYGQIWRPKNHNDQTWRPKNHNEQTCKPNSWAYICITPKRVNKSILIMNNFMFSGSSEKMSAGFAPFVTPFLLSLFGTKK